MASAIQRHAAVRLSLFLGLLMLSASGTSAERPWEGRPFSGSPQQLKDAFQDLPIPENSDIEVFLQENQIWYADDGRRIVTTHLVYRILTASGVNSYGTVAAVWSPWHEQRPILNARVISTDGKEYNLIEREISEVPAQKDENIYSDERRLQAPLPAVQCGSIVETLTVVEETRPVFAGGHAEFLAFNQFVNTHKVVWRIDVPAEHPFRFQEFGPGLTLSDTTSDGRRRLEWSATEHLGLKSFEADTPADVIQGTQVVYSTASSWEDIARCYYSLINGCLNEQDLDIEVQEILAGETDRDVSLEKLSSYVKQQIRYTGLMFGNGTIVPAAPKETLRRRYGDCKDKSVLLIGLLRAAGIDAHPVLLRSTFGRDIRPDMPGLGLFNHMIVHVPGDRELWIDPTANMVPLRELPAADQDRFCLIVKPDATSLSRTPAGVPEDNKLLRVRDVYIDDLGGATIKETTTYTGAPASTLREIAVSVGDREFRANLSKSAEERLLSTDIREICWTSLQDTSTPLKISYQAHKCGLAEYDIRQAQLNIAPGIVLKSLPAEILDVRPYMTEAETATLARQFGDASDEPLLRDKQRRRTHPLVNRQPTISEFVCRIHWPAGFETQHIPEATKILIGEGFVESSYELLPDGVLSATFRSSTGSKPLTQSEIERWQSELKTICASGNPDEWSVDLKSQHVSNRHFENGDATAGFNVLRNEVAANPEYIPARLRLAESYGLHGFIEVARNLAIETVAMAPQSSEAHRTAGMVHGMHSWCAAPSNDDLRNSLDYYRKSAALDPSNLKVKVTLANLLRIQLSHQSGDRDSMKEAANLLIDSNVILNENGHYFVAQCLFLAEEYDRLIAWLNEIPAYRFSEGMKLAATTLLDGPQKSQGLLKELPPSERELAVLLTLDLLNAGRHYDQISDFINADTTLRGRKRTEVAELFEAAKTLRRYEKVLLRDASVHAVLQRVYINAAVGHDLFGPSDDLIHNSKNRKPLIEASIKSELVGSGSGESGSPRLSARLADTVSLLRYAVEGNETTGYRVAVVMRDRRLNIYLASCDGHLKVVATDDCVSFLGEEALRLLAIDNPVAARQFVQWGFEATGKNRIQANVTPKRLGIEPDMDAPLQYLWSATDGNHADPTKIKLAAMALATPRDVVDAMPFLTSVRKTARPAEQFQIDRVMFYWCVANKAWKDALIVGDRLAQNPQTREFYQSVKLQLLFNDKQYFQIKSALFTQTNRRFPDKKAQSIVARVALAMGQSEEAVRLYRELADRGDATPLDFNHAAWAALFLDRLDDRIMLDATRAVDEFESPSAMHTLACVYAELGRNDSAMQQIRQCNERSDRPATNTDNFYVPGRVAEQLNMSDVAMFYYRLSMTSESIDRPDGTAQLAMKRLRTLKQSTPDHGSPSSLPVREVSNSESTTEVN